MVFRWRWCLHVLWLTIAANILGYLLAIELHDRISQNTGFYIMMVVVVMIDEAVEHVQRRRRALSLSPPPASESSAAPFQDT